MCSTLGKSLIMTIRGGAGHRTLPGEKASRARYLAFAGLQLTATRSKLEDTPKKGKAFGVEGPTLPIRSPAKAVGAWTVPPMSPYWLRDLHCRHVAAATVKMERAQRGGGDEGPSRLPTAAPSTAVPGDGTRAGWANLIPDTLAPQTFLCAGVLVPPVPSASVLYPVRAPGEQGIQRMCPNNNTAPSTGLP